jgi:hypothetical protein
MFKLDMTRIFEFHKVFGELNQSFYRPRKSPMQPIIYTAEMGTDF